MNTLEDPQIAAPAKRKRRAPNVRKHATFLIGSGNLKALDEAGLAVVSVDTLRLLVAALPEQNDQADS